MRLLHSASGKQGRAGMIRHLDCRVRHRRAPGGKHVRAYVFLVRSFSREDYTPKRLTARAAEEMIGTAEDESRLCAGTGHLASAGPLGRVPLSPVA